MSSHNINKLKHQMSQRDKNSMQEAPCHQNMEVKDSFDDESSSDIINIKNENQFQSVFKEYVPGFGETTWKTIAHDDQKFIPNGFFQINNSRTSEFDDYYYYCFHMPQADIFHKVYFKIREEVIFCFGDSDDQDFLAYFPTTFSRIAMSKYKHAENEVALNALTFYVDQKKTTILHTSERRISNLYHYFKRYCVLTSFTDDFMITK